MKKPKVFSQELKSPPSVLILADGVRICVDKIVAYQPSGAAVLFVMQDGSRHYHSLPHDEAIQKVMAELDAVMGAERMKNEMKKEAV